MSDPPMERYEDLGEPPLDTTLPPFHLGAPPPQPPPQMEAYSEPSAASSGSRKRGRGRGRGSVRPPSLHPTSSSLPCPLGLPLRSSASIWAQYSIPLF